MGLSEEANTIFVTMPVQQRAKPVRRVLRASQAAHRGCQYDFMGLFIRVGVVSDDILYKEKSGSRATI